MGRMAFSGKVFEHMRERYRMIRDWRFWAERVKEVVRKYLPDARVYVFGSVVEGKAIASSDIDVLIVSGKAPQSLREKVELQLRIEDELGLEFPKPNPFEFHIVTPKEAEWYFKYLKIKYVEV